MVALKIVSENKQICDVLVEGLLKLHSDCRYHIVTNNLISSHINHKYNKKQSMYEREHSTAHVVSGHIVHRHILLRE